MTELKTCPFCGRVPVVDDCGNHRYFVKCKCGIEQSRLYAQKCDAVRHWNRRKDEPQTDEPKWTCERCGFENYANFKWCFHCGSHKPERSE